MFRDKNALIPHPRPHNLPPPINNPTLPPHEPSPKTALIPIAIPHKHLAKALPLPTSKLALIANPILPAPNIIQLAPAIKMILLPLPLILQIAIHIVELALALHFAFDPISVVVGVVRVGVFAFAVAEGGALLALVTVAVRVDLLLDVWGAVLGG
jgi:hypothetical protein